MTHAAYLIDRLDEGTLKISKNKKPFPKNKPVPKQKYAPKTKVKQLKDLTDKKQQQEQDDEDEDCP